MIDLSNYNNFLSESFLDYPDNSSLSVIFYMPGCDRKCKGCHNVNLQDSVIYKDQQQIIDGIYNYCLKSKTNKLCLQGGDPLYKSNIDFTKIILQSLSNKVDICIYTGAEINEIKAYNLKGFKFIKCGKFDINNYVGSLKTNEYLQFASKNQQLYDKDLNLVSKDGIYYF